MICVHLSERRFQVVYPLTLWSRSSGILEVQIAQAITFVCVHISMASDV